MAGNDSGSHPADTMRRRVPGNTLKMWVLMEANRWVLAGGLLGLLLVSFVTVGFVDPSPIAGAIEAKDPIETFFQAMVTAVITGVTLVVTLNQLVLSQELGAAGDQRTRMGDAIDFRRDVESHIEEPVSPAEPSTFLQALVDAVGGQADSLAGAVESGTSEPLREDVDAFVAEVTENAEQVGDRLESAEFGTFQMLSAALDFNYSTKIYEARRLRTEYEERLPDDGDAVIEEMITTLELFGPAREHFKTLYFQWELINLSRAVVYAAIPALVTAGAMILFFDDPGSLPGTTAGISNVLLVTSLAAVVTFTPFVLLLSYILRIATIAKRTLAIGPFVLRGEAPGKEEEWD